MRVLMVTGSYPPQPCGVGNYTHKLVQELAGTGLEVDIATTASEPPRNEPRVTLELSNWGIGSLGRAFSRIHPETYDIVHVQYPARYYGYTPALALLVLRLKWALPRTPILVTLHEFSITHFFRKLTVGGITTPATHVTLTTDSERAPLLRWFPWLSGKVSVVQMAPSIPTDPIDASRRDEIRKALGVEADEQLVAYFGLLHPNKGIRKLIEALGSKELENRALHLLCLSHFDPLNNPFHAELRDISREVGADSKVIWAGYLDDRTSSEYISASDIVCLPFEDGVTLRRLSFMAAMGLGMPTISTVGEVNPEQMGLESGEHVLLLPSDVSPSRLGEAIGSLLDSRELREVLSRAAKTWASRFSWEAVVEETLALYNDLRRVSGL